MAFRQIIFRGHKLIFGIEEDMPYAAGVAYEKGDMFTCIREIFHRDRALLDSMNLTVRDLDELARLMQNTLLEPSSSNGPEGWQ